MPGMDGFETARRIRERERTRHIPIIFVTAFGRSDRDVLDAYRLGAVDFLFKPVEPIVIRAKAAIFVALQERTAEVLRQAALLREHERHAHEEKLEKERRRLEEDFLRAQMQELAAADR
jgi:CheY-like chemotaxis protein